MAPIISIYIAATFETMSQFGWELYLIILPAYGSWIAFLPVVQMMLFYLIFGSEFILWSFIDELLVVALQHWVPFATFGISFMSVLWAFAISRAADYGDAWNLIAISYTVQAYFFNKRLYDALPGAIRFIKPTWNYVEEGQPLYPNIFYWFGFASNDPIDTDEPSSNTQPIDDKNEEEDSTNG